MTCQCGHHQQWHNSFGMCTAKGCECLYFEERTLKVEAAKPIPLAVAPEKCRHCYRRTEGRCSKCGTPLCAICMWPTRVGVINKEQDYCRPCRDAAVASASND